MEVSGFLHEFHSGCSVFLQQVKAKPESFISLPAVQGVAGLSQLGQALRSVQVCVTYRGGGDDLFSHNPQCVHHRNITQPPSNSQSCVAILHRKAKHYTCVCMCACVRVRVSVCVLAYHSGSVGFGTVLQQHINDVCVSLLRCLMQGSVSVLKAQQR